MRNGLNPRHAARRARFGADRSSTPCRSAVPPPPPTVRAAATAAATASATTVQLCSQTVPGPWRATAPATTRTRVAPTRECCLYVMASDSDSRRTRARRWLRALGARQAAATVPPHWPGHPASPSKSAHESGLLA
eukprot:SAG31_NODE_6435_length_2020_cov_4.287350_1_plen_135_part_00